MKLEHDREYLKGALSARDFLRRTQAGLKLHRHFEPKALRWEYQLFVLEKSPEYRAGFWMRSGCTCSPRWRGCWWICIGGSC